MARRVLTGTILALSSILLAFSVIAIAAIWIYNEQLTHKATDRLVEIDAELAQAQATLQASQKELERALQIVDATEKALQKLVEPSGGGSETVFESIQSTLDDRLIPDLKTTRERIDEARATLESLQSTLDRITSFVPFVDLKGPGQIVANLIVSATSLNADISRMQVVAQQASVFVSDSSYLLGGDFSETRKSLQNFLSYVQDYEKRVTGWREQITEIKEAAPRWIDRASIGLTIFLLWFAVSQFGMILHGIGMQYGENPLWILRGK